MKNQKFTTHHGMSYTGTYHSWSSMVKRCTNKKCKDFPSYGGRGISVCERWLKFENFLSDVGVKPKGMSIDRINNDWNYEPGNVRWANRKTQNRNTRRNRFVILRGQKFHVTDAARELGMPQASFYNRLRTKGRTLQEIVDHFAARHDKAA